MGGAGSDVGAKVGLVSLMYLTSTGKVTAAWIVALAKGTAAAAVSPYVVVPVAVVGTGYVSYKIYRYCNPTLEEKVELAKKIAGLEAEITKKIAEKEHAELQANKEHEESDHIKVRQELRECLAKNIKEPRQQGIPLSCEEKATIFAMRAAKGEMEEILAAFNTYSE